MAKKSAKKSGERKVVPRPKVDSISPEKLDKYAEKLQGMAATMSGVAAAMRELGLDSAQCQGTKMFSRGIDSIETFIEYAARVARKERIAQELRG
jgi:hypothetical protein